LSAVVILSVHIIMYLKYVWCFVTRVFRSYFYNGIKGYPEGYSSNPSLNPWYAYYEILASNYEPWLIFFLIGLYRIAKDFKTYADDRRKLLYSCCAGVSCRFALFQAAKVKQYHYIMPLYIPITIIAASALGNFRESCA